MHGARLSPHPHLVLLDGPNKTEHSDAQSSGPGLAEHVRVPWSTTAADAYQRAVIPTAEGWWLEVNHAHILCKQRPSARSSDAV